MGRVVVADINIIPPKWVPSTASDGASWKFLGWGMGEYMLRIDEKGQFDAKGSIVSSFEVAPDNSSITFRIRKGVPFHGDWGEVTADDVVWSWTNAMRADSKFYRRSGMQRQVAGVERIDQYTVRLNWKPGQFLPWWLQSYSQTRSATPWIAPKAIVDKYGEDKAVDMAIGTGPFQVVTWLPSERLVLKAVSPHWRQTPSIAQLEFVEIREPLVMVAAFKTREVDLAPIPNLQLKDALAAVPASQAQVVGYGQAACINFAGNYWAMKDWAGKDIFPRPGFDPTLPWVGDPRDPAHMERAQKVRMALALAIDRDTIKDKVFGGFGDTYAVLTSGFQRSDPWWKKEWEIPYNPERAKKLLVEAGYPKGFTIPLWVMPDHPRVNPEAGQAVAQYWRVIGMDVNINSTAKAAREPLLFEPGGPKGHNMPFYHCGIVGEGADKPWDGAMGPTGTYRGVELPDRFWPLHYANYTEPSFDKRVQNNIVVADFVTEQALQFAFYVGPSHYAVGPRIKSWKPHPIDAPMLTAPESIVLK